MLPKILQILARYKDCFVVSVLIINSVKRALYTVLIEHKRVLSLNHKIISWTVICNLKACIKIDLSFAYFIFLINYSNN